ncbi:MAG: valyl-tRNA synthetase [Alphaproteobacteria bacterium]|nr:valyl-tRNA synthetase [Alphaproteobacteria bacterium]
MDHARQDGAEAKIVRSAIYTGIGVARIGNSPEDYFIGPETMIAQPRDPGFYRDAAGALKRQGARFRVYGYDAAGEVVRELTGDEVEWTVHVANRKAEWYRFIAALDIPDAVSLQTILRNKKVAEQDRHTLVIDAGPRTISGVSKRGDKAWRLDGSFLGAAVDLGEILTDEAGRLIFLGGLGKAGSPDDSPLYDPSDMDSYNNADGWYDDISDGPVTAKVRVDGVQLDADPAWVIVAPPNYGPGLVGWRSMYDLMRGLFTDAGQLPFPDPVLFTRDILPQLQRLSELQWVNKGIAGMFGAGGPLDFGDPALIERLAAVPVDEDHDPWIELRRTTYNSFRSTVSAYAPGLWPWLYGDAFGSFAEDSPRNNLALPDFQAALLRQWVLGNFVDDRASAQAVPADLDAMPLPDRPAMLDRAAMSHCIADAFHPGCEMTWPMRHASLYTAPFRIRPRPEGQQERFYGTFLDQVVALGADGPLGEQGPGTITRYMALPWQGDTATCRSGYDTKYDPYLSTFWPARVPNQVLDEADYEIAMDEARPRAERLAAFHRRVDWEFSVLGKLDYPAIAESMIDNFHRLGIVEKRPGPTGDPDIPPIVYVSKALPPPRAKLRAHAARLVAEGGEAPASGPLAEAGWRSEEHRRSFEAVRFRNRR